jgi:hypothetical protein
VTIVLVLDGRPTRIDGGNYPAGVGIPSKGDQLVVHSERYEVVAVSWHIDPEASHALPEVRVTASKLGEGAPAIT